MTRCVLGFLWALIGCFPVFGQERDYVGEMIRNDLRIRQKPAADRLLSDYLKPSNIQEDTVYAIIYEPNACPRCEAAIPNFYRLLKADSPANKMLLISVYEDSAACSRYNEKNNYLADYYLYDVRDSYKDIFSFNTGEMVGLYILKLCPKSGVMITGGQYTVLGSAFVRQLKACTERLEPRQYGEAQVSPAPSVPSASGKGKGRVVRSVFYGSKASADPNNPCKGVASRKCGEIVETWASPGTWRPAVKARAWECLDIPLVLNEERFVSKVYDVPQYEDGYFFYTDLLENGVMLFEQQGKSLVFKSFIEANDEEKKRFVEVPEAMYQHLKQAGNVFYIPLTAHLADSGKLAVSYSLPRIWEQKNGGIAFYNAAVILMRDLRTLEEEPMVVLDMELGDLDTVDLGNLKYFYPHFYYDIFNRKVWLGCLKMTWPMDGYQEEDCKGRVELDPHDDKFYDTFNPIVASFGMDGKRLGHYGRLEESQRVSQTGYYFHYNVFAHHKGDFLYSNGYTGVLYVSDSTQTGLGERKYTAFDMDLSGIPVPDSSLFYQREYFSLYAATFSRCIAAVKMDDEQIYCLVRYADPVALSPDDNAYTYVVINRKSGKRREFALPAYPEVKNLGYGIGKEEGAVFPFLFIRDKGAYYVRTLR